MSDITLFNELELAKRKSPIGEYVTLTGTPSNGKFLPLDGSTYLRSEYPEFDAVFPSPPDTTFTLPTIPNKYIQVKP